MIKKKAKEAKKVKNPATKADADFEKRVLLLQVGGASSQGSAIVLGKMTVKLEPLPMLVDYSAWTSKPLWKLHQAVCLSVGLAPENYSPHELRKPTQIMDAIADGELRDRWGTIYGEIKAATITDDLKWYAPVMGNLYLHRQFRPAVFVEWAIKKGFKLPRPIEALAKSRVKLGSLTLSQKAHSYATDIDINAKEAGATLTRMDICAKVAMKLVENGATRERGKDAIDAEYVRRRLLGDRANKWERPKSR